MATAKTTTKKNVIAMKEPEVSAQITALREDIALLATALKVQTKSTVAEKTATVKTTVADAVDTIKTAKADTTETAKQKYDLYSTKAENSIRENPLTSVAIAVGAGLLLGAITRR